MRAWENNLLLARLVRPVYFGAIDTFLSKREPRWFRWHVAGDIPDTDYVNWMHSIADIHRNTKFLVFTKRYLYAGLAHLPENVSVVLSAWPHYTLYRGDFPVAWLDDPDDSDPRIPHDALECAGNCASCGMCWHLKDIGRDVKLKKL